MFKKIYEKKLANINPKKEWKRSIKYFSENDFSKKMLKHAKKMGTKLSHYSLLLFYSFKSPHTPKKAKLTIAGALGYLILPIDVIPDFIPIVGFADDLAIISYAIYSIIEHIDEDVKEKTHNRMKKIFGEEYDEEEIELDVEVK